MSAAATAAGYLYASRRLPGRNADELEAAKRKPVPRERKRVRVAVYVAEERPKPRRVPKIEYRVRRRWSLE